MRSYRPLAFVLLFITAGCGGLAGEPEIIATIPPRVPAIITPASEDDPLALGQSIFMERCSSCHGLGGRGDGALVRSGALQNVPDMTDSSRRAGVTLDDYYEIITHGRIENMMPPWADALTEAERRAVAAYAYSLAEQAASAAQPAPQSGTVRGVIANGTGGMADPTALDVMLFVMNNAGEEIATLTTAAEDGLFAFEDVPVQQSYAYVASVTYQDVTFISPLALGRDLTEDALDMPITVYEVTDNPDVIAVDLLLTQVVLYSDEAVEMLLVMRVTNTSDHVYRSPVQVDEQRYETVRVHLPESAVPVALDALRYEWDEANNVLIDTLPVLPESQHIVHVTYFMPLREVVSVAYQVEYAMRTPAELMLIPGQFDVQSTQFVSQGVMEFTGGVFEDYLADPLPAGETLRFDLMLRPPQAAGEDSQAVMALILVGIGGGFMALAGGLYVYQRRRSSLADALVVQLAELDLRYQAQEINEATYQAQRQQLRQRLSRLMRDEPGASGG